MAGEVLYVDKGIVRLSQGSTLAIEQVQYSANGIDGWEGTFNPLPHTSTVTPPLIVEGHKYRRVKHAVVNSDGSVTVDAAFQLPSQFTAEDGEPIELVNDGTYIKWKYLSDSEWTNLEEVANLKGLQGDTGPQGKGLEIKRAGSLELRPMVGQPVVVNTGCGCTSTPTVQEACLYLSLGNHKLTAADVGKYFIANNVTAETYTLATTDHIGEYVRVWNALESGNTSEGALSCNSQGMVGLYHELVEYDSVGKIYIFADYLWTELTNIATPTGQLKMNDLDSLGFLGDKVDNSTIEANVDNNLQVKDSGITFAKLNTNAFGNGIEVISNKYVVNPDNIVGSGLIVTGIGINKKLAIDPSGLPGFGLDYNVTTEALDVVVEDLVVASEGITVDNLSPNKKLKIQRGDGITLVANAITVKPDVLGPITVATNGVNLNINTNELEVPGGILGIKDSFITGLFPRTNLTVGTGLALSASGTNAVLASAPIQINLDLANINHDDLATRTNDAAHPQYLLKSVVTTAGDILLGVGAGVINRLGIGLNGRVLTSNGTTASWETPAAAPTAGTTALGSTYKTTTNDGGSALTWSKSDHTHAIIIPNASLDIVQVSGLQAALDAKVIGAGTNYTINGTDVILKSAGGTSFMLKVDDAGNLFTTAV